MTRALSAAPFAAPVAGRPGLVDVAMIRHAATERAVKLSTCGDKERAIWLPLSQVEVACQESDEFSLTGGVPVIVTMPDWMARDRGLM